MAYHATRHVLHTYNELHQQDPDRRLTIPILIDSSLAIAVMESDHDNVGTRHIARRFYIVRDAVLQGRL